MLTEIPNSFQPLTDDDRATYGEPELIHLAPPTPGSDRCRRKLANWLDWRAAPYPAPRHSEYLFKPDEDGVDGARGPKILLAAMMPTPPSPEAYLTTIPHKRRYTVQGRKAINRGYTSHAIRPADHNDGIWNVIHSSEERQGRPIVGMFADRPPDHDFADYEPTGDPLFDDLCTGVFAPDGTLAAYLLGKRVGDHVQYDEIMGHADHVGHDVMYLLHFSFLAQCAASPAPPGCLNYGSWYSGSDPFSPGGGLNRWKRKVRFRPAYLILASS